MTTRSAIKAYFLTRANEDWRGLCQAAAWRVCKEFGWLAATYPSAWSAWSASATDGTDHRKAVAGDWHYWRFEGYAGGVWGNWGHVALDLGDGMLFMAWGGLSGVGEHWGGGLGVVHIDDFNRVAGLQYAGYSHTNGANDVAIEPEPVEPPLPYQRIVAAKGVIGRTAPTTASAQLQEFEPGEKLDMKNVRDDGEDVWGDGNRRWFQGAYAGAWFHSSRFLDQSATGLIDVTPGTTTPPPPPLPPYTFTKSLACVTRVVPAHRSNFQVGNFPAKPAKVVLHDFGTRGLNTMQSVVSYFTTDHTNDEPHQVSAKWAVSRREIVQFVADTDRAWHGGPNGNDFDSIEIDPIVGSDDPADAAAKEETITSVRLLLTELGQLRGYNPERIKHSSFAQTACGDDIDLRRYQIGAVVPDPVDEEPPVVEPPVVEPPVVEPPVVEPPVKEPSQEVPWLVVAIGVVMTAIIGFLSQVFGG